MSQALAAALALTMSSTLAAAAELPPAPVRDVPTTHHGVVVHDPYRYMEDTASPEVQAWLRAQGDAARAVLERIDVRQPLLERMRVLSGSAGDRIEDLLRMPGDRLYYLKRAAGANQFVLAMRRGLQGHERVLVDPEDDAKRAGVPHAINWYRPSWNGRYVAYGISSGGSEQAEMRVLDTATGRVIGPPVPRVVSGDVAWAADDRSIFFTQNKALAPNDPPTEYSMDATVRHWRLGEPPERARTVFGREALPALKLDRLDFPSLLLVPDSPWVVVRTTDTTVPEGRIFIAPRAALATGKPVPWREIAGPQDGITDFALDGQRLLLRTHAGAPRYRLLALDLRRPVLAEAREWIAQPRSGVFEGFARIRGGIVTLWREGTSFALRRHAPGDPGGQPIPLPFPGTTQLVSAPVAERDELLFRHEGWDRPAQLFAAQGASVRNTGLLPATVPPGLQPLTITDVEVPSHDGVKVPMTVLHRAGLALDGSAPVLLSGYGAYGFSMSAFWAPTQMAWLERGGVLAFVNPRGSGVHGDDWHRAGFKQTKANTWLDGIACARWLVAQRYGSAATMGVMGGSAGGIFAGRAATAAPDLFAAAVIAVGVTDTVRFEESANGVTNVSELGTVKDPSEFEGLLRMSTYNAITDGTAYPAVLLTHGLNDPRVDVWQSAKTTARLQAASSSGKPVLLRLDAEAGHGVGSTTEQRIALWADTYAFLLWQMGKAALRPAP